MKSRLTISILLGSALAAALAGCGYRNSGKELILQAPGAKDSQKARQCSQTISSSNIRVDSEKVKIAGKSIAAPLCMQAELLSDYSAYTNEKPESAPKVKKYQLSQPQRRTYTVGKGEGKTAKISLRLGVDFVLDPSETAEAAIVEKWRQDAFSALKDDCVTMLTQVWQASKLSVDLDLHLYTIRKGGSDNVTLDQKIVLAGTPASRDVK